MKFKLLKKFPDCNLEVGDTINFDESDEIEIYQKGVIYWYTLDEVKQYPEFFELVVEKDYEILEFTRVEEFRKGEKFYILQDKTYDTNSSEYGGVTLEHMLNTGNCVKDGSFVISKVKRLSDNEVFSIGDKVTGMSYPETGIINKFELKDSRLIVWVSSTTGVGINKIKKYVEPILFVTEDGYEVKNFKEAKDFHWILDDGDNTKYLYNNCPLSKAHLDVDICLGSKANYKLFASEEKAKAYVAKKNEEKLLDSKVLSYNEVLEIADKVGIREFYYRSQFEKELKELVKSKQ